MRTSSVEEGMGMSGLPPVADARAHLPGDIDEFEQILATIQGTEAANLAIGVHVTERADRHRSVTRRCEAAGPTARAAGTMVPADCSRTDNDYP